jgi:ATP-dependent DNA ligase
MLLLRCDELPGGQEWLRDLKLDGYRAVAIKSESRKILVSLPPEKYH